jgi:F420H(2)-dependent quinone reductase
MSLQKLYNPLVAGLLRCPLHGLISRSTALLTICGQRSGRLFTFPVSYVREGDSLFILTRADRMWWRNLRKPTDVVVRLEGRDLFAKGQIIDNRATVRHIAMALMRRFGAISDEDGSIVHTEKLDASLSGLLVVRIDPF